MKTIYKYLIPPAGEKQTIQLPVGAKILTVGVQGYRFVLWAEIDSQEKANMDVHIAIVGTGSPLPENGKYLGTAFMGEFVWHIYEVENL